MRHTLKYVLLTALFVAGLFLYACEKPKDSQIRITVVDASGNPVANAKVTLQGQPSDSIYVNRLTLYDLEKTTNEGGIAVFIFNDFYDQGANGFAVLDVTVTKDTLEVTDYVKVIEEEVVEKKITLD